MRAYQEIFLMRVLFDHQIFEQQSFGGISRYHMELIDHLDDADTEISILYSDNRYLKDRNYKLEGRPANYQNWLKGKEFKGKWTLYNWLGKTDSKTSRKNQELSIERLEDGGFDIFHPTDTFSNYFLPFLGERSLVVTVHDTIAEFMNKNTPIPERAEVIGAADSIICVSDYTCKNLIRFYDIDPSKIQVVHHGLSFEIHKGDTDKRNQLLYVGARSDYKNFVFMIEAIADSLKKEKLKLICVGNPFSREELRLFKVLGIDQLVENRSGDDSLIKQQYRESLAFIYPSLEEGFGMPVLEAMSQGCPVIASNRASIPEVAGDAAVFFDPEDSGSLVNALSSILHDEGTATEYIERGLRRCGDFDWLKAAEETMEVYKSVLA